jgi:uncharacterized membrane protein YqgA involved in biofilm formation
MIKDILDIFDKVAFEFEFGIQMSFSRDIQDHLDSWTGAYFWSYRHVLVIVRAKRSEIGSYSMIKDELDIFHKMIFEFKFGIQIAFSKVSRII